MPVALRPFQGLGRGLPTLTESSLMGRRYGPLHPEGNTSPGHCRPRGAAVRILQRILALTAAIWYNDHTGQPVMRLTVYGR
jgi:hypothetical protein